MPQPLTKAGIANAALLMIGQKQIPSTDTSWTTTKEAVQVASIFELARLTALTAVNWKFARTRLALVAEATETLTGWDYIWDYPSNKHYVRKVFTDTEAANPDPVEYIVFYGTSTEAQYIATKVDDCYCEATDTSVGTTTDHYLFYDPLFTMAFICQIAALIAKPLTGKESEQNRMLTLYSHYIDMAKLKNMQEQEVISTRKSESEVLEARG